MEDSDLPQVAANPACSAANILSRKGRRNQILVADDEPEILSEISTYLRRRGEVVVDVQSFGGAVQAFNDRLGSIALVISDVRMPDGNGVDLVRWVINRSEGKCPCLLMTGHLDVAGLGADLETAGVRIIDKPFAMSALYDLVRSALIPTAERLSET